MTHWACQYIGLPWQSGGRDKAGFDCWGLMKYVQQHHFNRTLPDIPVDAVNLTHVAKAFKQHPEKQRWQLTANPAEGDAVLLRQSRYPIHVGIWIAINATEQGVLHCVQKSGVVFQTINSLHVSGWQIEGFYQFQGDLL